MEEFITIPSFPNYEISLDGVIRNKKTGRILKLQDCYGYRSTVLSMNGKQRTVYVHRLLAEIHIPNPENKPQVNHIDGNKQNNDLSNLEWNSASENMTHAYKIGLKKPAASRSIGDSSWKSTLTAYVVLEIGRLIAAGSTTKAIAARYGLDKGAIKNIRRWKRWKTAPEAATPPRSDSKPIPAHMVKLFQPDSLTLF